MAEYPQHGQLIRAHKKLSFKIKILHENTFIQNTKI